MNAVEILAAADSFVRHQQRRPGQPWEEAWTDWIRFRRLDAADAAAIRHVVHETLFGMGETTDPPPIAA